MCVLNMLVVKLSVCFFKHYTRERGHAVAQLVEALCYKQEGRAFESR
jgi:hypothetical protein